MRFHYSNSFALRHLVMVAVLFLGCTACNDECCFPRCRTSCIYSFSLIGRKTRTLIYMFETMLYAFCENKRIIATMGTRRPLRFFVAPYFLKSTKVQIFLLSRRGSSEEKTRVVRALTSTKRHACDAEPFVFVRAGVQKYKIFYFPRGGQAKINGCEV